MHSLKFQDYWLQHTNLRRIMWTVCFEFKWMIMRKVCFEIWNFFTNVNCVLLNYALKFEQIYISFGLKFQKIYTCLEISRLMTSNFHHFIPHLFSMGNINLVSFTPLVRVSLTIYYNSCHTHSATCMLNASSVISHTC